MFKKRISVLLMCAVCAISSSLASALESKGFDVQRTQLFAEPLNESLDVSELLNENKIAYTNIDTLIININLAYDYGGDIELQVNSEKLAYRESNVFVANFDKVQNQNFERMPLVV